MAGLEGRGSAVELRPQSSFRISDFGFGIGRQPHHAPLLLFNPQSEIRNPQSKLVVRGGFEPPKAEPADLQSAPFDRSGTSPLPTRNAELGTRNTCASLRQPDGRSRSFRLPRSTFRVPWSRRGDSDPQPPVYKTGALPLSYAGHAETPHYIPPYRHLQETVPRKMPTPPLPPCTNAPQCDNG